MAEGIGGTPRAVAHNIEAVVRLEQEAASRRPPSSRVADLVARLAGRLRFVLLHTALVVAWVLDNTGHLPGLPVFDPYPFGLLGLIFSLEGLLLAAFVLMKQMRMSAEADRRAHLDLQISLLSEREITRLIQMLQRVSDRLGIGHEMRDAETREMGETTAVDSLVHQLHERLPEER